MDRKPAWAKPVVTELKLKDLEAIADLDVAFATYCTEHSLDYSGGLSVALAPRDPKK